MGVGVVAVVTVAEEREEGRKGGKKKALVRKGVGMEVEGVQ